MITNNIYDYYMDGNQVDATEIARSNRFDSDSTFKKQCEMILDEMMKRVKVNTELMLNLFDELSIKDEQKEISKTEENIDSLINELILLLGSFGEIPMSVIKFFHYNSSEVSLVNMFKEIPYDLNPFQFYSLSDTLKYIKFALPDYVDLYLKDLSEENYFVPFIANDLAKSGVSSGGELVGVKIYKEKKFDGLLLNIQHECMFIDYLRAYFDRGGFLNLEEDTLLVKENPKIKTYLKEYKNLMVKF